MNTAKRAVRRLLPAPADNAIRRALHARRLRRVPAREVDLSRLPAAGEVPLPALFDDDGLGSEWDLARRRIGEVFEYENKWQAVDVGVRRALWYLVRRWKPRAILEIGTLVGASTVHMAMALRACGHAGAPVPRLVTVDLNDVNDPAGRPWLRHRVSASPREMLARLDCAGLVEFVVASSLDYLAGRDAEFDFIFVDHAASADIVYREIPLALTALAPGGQCLMDAYYPDGQPLHPGGVAAPGPYLAVRRLRREGVPLAALPLGPLPWPTAPGGADHSTSLALLARERRAADRPGGNGTTTRPVHGGD